jgi:hypothetical protein
MLSATKAHPAGQCSGPHIIMFRHQTPPSTAVKPPRKQCRASRIAAKLGAPRLHDVLRFCIEGFRKIVRLRPRGTRRRFACRLLATRHGQGERERGVHAWNTLHMILCDSRANLEPSESVSCSPAAREIVPDAGSQSSSRQCLLASMARLKASTLLTALVCSLLCLLDAALPAGATTASPSKPVHNAAARLANLAKARQARHPASTGVFMGVDTCPGSGSVPLSRVTLNWCQLLALKTHEISQVLHAKLS